MVTPMDAEREAVLGPVLQGSLQAQVCLALSTPRSPAPGEPPRSGRTEAGAEVVPPRQLSQVQAVHLHHP